MREETYRAPPIDRYILPNRVLCGTIGLWPVDDDSSATLRACAYFRLAFAFAATGCVFVPAVLTIAINWGDLTVLTGVGCVATTLAQLLFKMSYVVARRRRMLALYRDVRGLWEISDSPGDRSCFEDLARHARTLTICFSVSGVSSALMFTVAALVVTVAGGGRNATAASRTLPLEAWYGHEDLQSPGFEMAFASQFVASVVCSVGVCGLDTILMTLLLHVCGQLKLIQRRIHAVGASIGESAKSGKVCLRDVRYGVRNCVLHHQHMLKLVNEVNDLWAPIVFVQILTSGLEICLSGYALKMGTSRADVVKFTSYLLSGLIQLLVWCWPADILVQESQEVANAAFYDVPWYNLPGSCQRDLCFLIVRSQKYLRITAYTFQTISITTLTSVFNTAASYFTLLREVQ